MFIRQSCPRPTGAYRQAGHGAGDVGAEASLPAMASPATGMRPDGLPAA
jgi:hypothetical protein